MSKLARLVAVCVVGLLPIVVSPSTAHADPALEIRYADDVGGTVAFDTPVYTNPEGYGIGGFKQDGDYVRVRDVYQHGAGVGVHWRIKTVAGDVLRRGICIDQEGYWAGNTQCNYNFGEGLRLEIRVGVCDGSKVDCTNLDNWSHFGAWRVTYA
ncbi:MAG: hypothetical protein QM747_19240 [Nocardioides sp.]